MKKIVSLAGVLMVLAAGSAFAAGVNGSWDDCGLNGVPNKTVTCSNSATALQKWYTSFVLPASIPANAAADANVDVQAPNTLGTWWLGGAARFGFTLGPATCGGWYDGAPNGGIGVGPNIIQTSPSRLRLRVVIAVATGQEQPLLGDGTEYFNHTIDMKFGLGTFGNAECVAGAAFRTTGLLLQQQVGTPTFMNTPQDDDCGTFRTAGGLTCPAATPTQKATWGSIKALYR